MPQSTIHTHRVATGRDESGARWNPAAGQDKRLFCDLDRQSEHPTGLQPLLHGARHLTAIERCAIVSESVATQRAATWANRVLPYEIRAYSPAERAAAKSWLAQELQATSLSMHYDADTQVLLIEPQAPLTVEDLNVLSRTLSEHKRQQPPLQAVIIHTTALPSWTDPGAFIRHMLLIMQMQRQLQRIAIAIEDQRRLRLLQQVLTPLLGAELRLFAHDDLSSAMAWAAAHGQADAHDTDKPAPTSAVRPMDRVHEAGIESFPASDPPAHTPR